jgi:hypothetical protein
MIAALQDMCGTILSIYSQPADIEASAMRLYLATLRQEKISPSRIESLRQHMMGTPNSELPKNREACCQDNSNIILGDE